MKFEHDYGEYGKTNIAVASLLLYQNIHRLNIYNFVRITCGDAKGSYTHDLLVRGKPDICRLMVRTKIKRKGSKSMSMSNSSEKLNELVKQQNSAQVAAVRPRRSLDDMASMMMARSSLNGVGKGFPNQVFGQIQQQQGFNDSSSNDGSQEMFFPQGANSNQTASALQSSFIPNQIMMPNVVSSGSNVGNNNATNQFGQFTNPSQQQQQMQGHSFLSPQAAPRSRRLSLKLFQDLTMDLSSNRTAPTAGTGSCDVSMEGSTSHNDSVEDQYLQSEGLDHIFDDDIESVGEPVALEEASPYIRNPTISSDMAEGLLRSMFLNPH